VPSQLAHVGYGNFLSLARVVTVVPPASAPVQRLIREAKEAGIVIDVSTGRRTRAVALLDSGTIVLLGLSVKELGSRGLPTGTSGKRRRKRAR
jgi:regulator of extracellular matrix RemA (YlzA/DUF370 family)